MSVRAYTGFIKWQAQLGDIAKIAEVSFVSSFRLDMYWGGGSRLVVSE